jgi:glycerol-3-phosphate cytidylyltransferase
MKIGFTASAFDFLHSGHVAMLEEAKKQCDFLIVGLHTNPQIDRPEKNKPVQSTLERFIQLKGCKYVDEIIPYDTEADLLNLLNMLQPDVRIIGDEYRDKHFTGKELPIDVYYNHRKHTYSSTDFRNRLKS